MKNYLILKSDWVTTLIIIIFITAFAVTPAKGMELYITCTDEQAVTKQFPDSDDLIYNIIDSYIPKGTSGKVRITSEPSGILNIVFFFNNGNVRQINCKMIERKPNKITYAL